MNFTQVCAAVGLTTDQLLALMKNAQFPAPTDPINLIWNDAQITAFAATMAAVAAAGWRIDFNTQLATANWSALAASTPGHSMNRRPTCGGRRPAETPAPKRVPCPKVCLINAVSTVGGLRTQGKMPYASGIARLELDCV